MKILIDIPKEFEVDYNADRFTEFFQRSRADMDVCCGKYEHETSEMLEKAFAESRLYDPDKVVEQLKYNATLYLDKDGEKVLLDDVIEIVKAGGNADLLMDRAKSKSGERIPYDGKWK